MSNFSKWLGAGIGFTFAGPIGAIMGFAAASVFDKFTKEDFVKEQREFQNKSHKNLLDQVEDPNPSRQTFLIFF